MASAGVIAIWAVLGAYLLYSICCIVWEAHRPGIRDVPGPFIARYSNLVLKWNVLGGRRSKYIHALHQHYGPMVRISPDEVAVADLAAYRVIHSVNDGFPKGKWYMKIVVSMDLKDRIGMFNTTDPKAHAIRRKPFVQGASKSAVLQWEDQIKAKVRTAINKIERDALAGTADILKWWTLMTNDVVCEVAFGESFEALLQEKKPDFVHEMEITMIVTGVMAEFSPLMPLVQRLPIPALQHALSLLDRLLEVGLIAVRNARASSEKTIFSKMIASSEKTQQLSDTIIAQEACNLTIAGTDTTAIVLTYLVWTVLRRPDIKHKLIAELEGCSGDPMGKELETMPYLNAVIDETLRLYTPVCQSLVREVPTGGTTLCGYDLPGGTTVGTQAYTFHRDPTIFQDPLSFDPDRWLHATPKMKEAFVPWGGGARICLGQNIARLELMHATCAFFRTLADANVAEMTTLETMEYRDFFVIAPIGGKCQITLAHTKA